MIKDVRICVVGGGPGATEFLNQLYEKAPSDGFKQEVRVNIFEPRLHVGTGVAWENSSDALIANMRIEMLGPFDEEIDYVRRTIPSVLPTLGEVEYPPRNAVGMVLRQRFRDKARLFGTRNITFAHTLERINNIENEGGKLYVRFGHNGEEYDIVVLALGNLWSISDLSLRANNSTIFNNPWDDDLIREGIRPTDRVLIVGASLTSIDVTTVIFETGHKGPITWFSKSGGVPYIRPKQIPPFGLCPPLNPPSGHVPLRARFLTRSAIQTLANTRGGLTLEKIWDAVRRELSEHLDERENLFPNEASFITGFDFQGWRVKSTNRASYTRIVLSTF
jgi:uncharacterized NAD(P)/FAD-binding protein YdhS